MSKCSICGKEGFFLKINSSNRCKKCEAIYQKQEYLKLSQEEARIAATKEKELKQAEKTLYQLLDLYISINNNIFTSKRDEDCGIYLPQIEEKIKKCNLYCDLLSDAGKTTYFFNVLKEYAYSDITDKKYKLLNLQCELRNHYESSKKIYKNDTDILNSMLLQLRINCNKVKSEWEHNKKSIETAIEKKKRRKLDNQCTSVSSKNDLKSKHETKKSPITPKLHLEYCPHQNAYVVTDIETSGLVYNKNSIIEIAAIKVVNDKIIDTYSSFIHRDKPLDSKITKLTGITTAMLRDCQKSIVDVITEYMEFIGDLPLVGHNISSFDIKFINEAYIQNLGKSISNRCIDTLLLSRTYIKGNADYKLQTLASYLNISQKDAHRALDDCQTTYELYKYLQNIMPKV